MAHEIHLHLHRICWDKSGILHTGIGIEILTDRYGVGTISEDIDCQKHSGWSSMHSIRTANWPAPCRHSISKHSLDIQQKTQSIFPDAICSWIFKAKIRKWQKSLVLGILPVRGVTSQVECKCNMSSSTGAHAVSRKLTRNPEQALPGSTCWRWRALPHSSMDTLICPACHSRTSPALTHDSF